MSNMQIDVPSHPAVRSLGDKRPRSPASTSPQERPLKRVILAPGSVEGSQSTLLEHVIQKQPQVLPARTTARIQPSVFQERKGSDDWVAKTSGLKLDSPLLGNGREDFISLPEPGSRSCAESAEVGCMEDEPMITDVDETTSMMRGSWPHSSDMPSLPLYSTTSQSTSTHTTPTIQSDTRIHIHPTTPFHRGLRRSSLTHSSPTAISPSNSGIWRSPTPSSKKPRISIGPRPDCEKCKNGVKDHWMHID